MKQEIKETCGYLDLDQNFHKTQKEAEDANLKIKTRQIERKLDNFHVRLNSLWGTTEYKIHYQATEHVPTYKIKEKLLEDLCKAVLYDSDSFIEIIQEKKSLEKELDGLRKLQSHKDKWWLQFKWW